MSFFAELSSVKGDVSPMQLCTPRQTPRQSATLAVINFESYANAQQQEFHSAAQTDSANTQESEQECSEDAELSPRSRIRELCLQAGIARRRRVAMPGIKKEVKVDSHLVIRPPRGARCQPKLPQAKVAPRLPLYACC
eukprot:GILI01005459.1.p1 GENE.GILI01005459.1~~GILI01005459.1.p1  ORF type:complete len:138 (+),score=27.21 GILI01005459.1:57-470(+)